MSLEATLVLKPNVTVELHDAETGTLKHRQTVHNLIVATGRDVVRDLLSNVGNAPNFIALGTGTSAVTDSQTALSSEHYRNAFTRTITGASKITYQLHILAFDSYANGHTFYEVGLFRDAQRPYTDGTGDPIVLGGGTMRLRPEDPRGRRRRPRDPHRRDARPRRGVGLGEVDAAGAS